MIPTRQGLVEIMYLYSFIETIVPACGRCCLREVPAPNSQDLSLMLRLPLSLSVNDKVQVVARKVRSKDHPGKNCSYKAWKPSSIAQRVNWRLGIISIVHLVVYTGMSLTFASGIRKLYSTMYVHCVHVL